MTEISKKPKRPMTLASLPVSHHNGLFEKDTGKPVCGGCEGCL